MDQDIDRADDWIPAHIPGDVRLDLLAAHLISDPYIATNNEESQWVDQYDWWYRTQVPLRLEPGQRAHVVFHGIDYFSSVWAGGIRLGQHVGMFSPQVYEVTDRVHNGTLDLAVRVWGSHALPSAALTLWQRLYHAIFTRLQNGNPVFPHRIRTLKCQMSFGWDFAPVLRTCGIWDEAHLMVSGPIVLRDVWLRSSLPDDGSARVDIIVALHAAVAEQAEVCVDISPDGVVHCQPVSLPPGPSMHHLSLTIPRPRLWQPWERGEPSLSTVCIAVREADGVVSDERHLTMGLRSVSRRSHPGAHPGEDPWTFVVNGQPLFIRGINWVPADSIPGRVTAADYEALLTMAREAGVNMVRVWGGGLREKRAFYETCDRLGLLVWQEFPFAGSFFGYYLQDRAFLELVEQECRAIVRALRSHPCLALWCGGNEWRLTRHRPLAHLLERVVAEEDPDRPFHPVSPSRGDRHNWRVWHYFYPIASYTQERRPFVSEFGLQAVPVRASLESFLPMATLWPPNEQWLYHRAEVTKLWRYAQAFGPCTLDEFIAATQRAQALGIQIAVEHGRRHKYRMNGVMPWQFNEPWPAISWSLVDYYRRPKEAYYTLRRIFQPVLVSVDYPLRRYHPGEVFRGEVWVVNDLPWPLPGCTITARLGGQIVWYTRTDIPSDCAVRVGRLQTTVGEDLSLYLDMQADGCLLAANQYDLTYEDRERPRLRLRMIAFFNDLWTH